MKLDLNNTALRRNDDGLRSVVNVEPPQNDIDVPLDRSPSDIQRLGNFLIVESLYDQAEDLQLARTQSGPVLVSGHAIKDAPREILLDGSNAADRLETQSRGLLQSSAGQISSAARRRMDRQAQSEYVWL
jgi:hypothetical protein